VDRIGVVTDIAILDTSWLLELYQVPGDSKPERYGPVVEQARQAARGRMLVTVPVLFEVANHIVHVRNGDRRRKLIEQYRNDVVDSLTNEAPWTVVPTPRKRHSAESARPRRSGGPLREGLLRWILPCGHLHHRLGAKPAEEGSGSGDIGFRRAVGGLCRLRSHGRWLSRQARGDLLAGQPRRSRRTPARPGSLAGRGRNPYRKDPLVEGPLASKDLRPICAMPSATPDNAGEPTLVPLSEALRRAAARSGCSGR